MTKLRVNMYNRIIKERIKQKFFSGKVIILTGARQTGKTTLSFELIKDFTPKEIRTFNCDNPTDRELLADKDLEFLLKLIGEAKIVIIDEGQKVASIGQTLKLLADHLKSQKQILVTGSSSLNLLENTEEALTGRKQVFHLFPLSIEEIYPDKNLLALSKEMENFLIFGNYPEVVSQKSFDEKKDLLKELTSSYLYKDILEFQMVKNSEVVANLIRALAFQIGSEASYSELANLVGLDKKTVERYIDLLEKNFIVFRLSAYAKNKRREISKMKKIYFYDLGIRNSVINNFNFLSNRDDIGALWENFIIAERLKYQAYHKIYSTNYFWRTYDGSEVDFIEEREGGLYGYEFKWSDKTKRTRLPAKWLEYPNSSLDFINPKTISGFII